MLQVTGMSRNSGAQTSKVQETKDEKDLIKLKSFRTAKEAVNMKECPQKGDKELVTSICNKCKQLNSNIDKCKHRHFPNEDLQMASWYVKRFSTSLPVSEIPIKTTVSQCPTPGWLEWLLAKRQKITNIVKMQRKGNFCTWVGGNGN